MVSFCCSFIISEEGVSPAVSESLILGLTRAAPDSSCTMFVVCSNIESKSLVAGPTTTTAAVTGMGPVATESTAD